MKIEKKYVWLGLGFIVLLVIVIVVASIMGESNRQSAEPQMIFATQQTTQTPSIPVGTLPVSTPIQTASYTVGSVWEVVSIEEGGLRQYGFVYDIATFALVGQPLVTLRAHCAQPQWPSPEIGYKYVILNDRGVMIPEEGIKSNLQRFYILGVN